MADLSINFAGIKSPNPYWLASSPLTNSGYQVQRAFEAGWGGAVWKTLCEPAADFNNIELVSDRPIEENLKEIYETKKLYPERAIIASIMAEPEREKLHKIVKRVQDVGVDGIELNLGCPHGMSERMGSVVGQHPDLVEKSTMYTKEVAEVPIITKLTPNITDITVTAKAAEQGGANAVSMMNTFNSSTSLDLDTWSPMPNVEEERAHSGYSGPGVKPIALNMTGECARQSDFNIPISGIGGISSWQDTAEFMLMGSGNVQICTASMNHGLSLINDLTEGLNNYLDDKGVGSVKELIGQSVETYTDWSDLDLNHRVVARINTDICINCNKCAVVCDDTAHQCIDMLTDKNGKEYLEVREDECVGCNLCAIVCPVEGAIDMVDLEPHAPPMTSNDRSSILEMLNSK